MAFLYSCNNEKAWDCIKSTGEIVTENRLVSPFDNIIINGHLNVGICKSDSFFIQVTGGENLLPKLETKLEGSTLIIENNNRCDWVRDLDKVIEVKVGLPVILALSWDGTGRVKGNGVFTGTTTKIDVWRGGESLELELDVDSVYLREHSGVNDVRLSGRSNYLYAYKISWGLTDCRDLECNDVYVHHDSYNHLFVKADSSLSGRAISSGNVYYLGHPSKINVKELNEGKFLPL